MNHKVSFKQFFEDPINEVQYPGFSSAADSNIKGSVLPGTKGLEKGVDLSTKGAPTGGSAASQESGQLRQLKDRIDGVGRSKLWYDERTWEVHDPKQKLNPRAVEAEPDDPELQQTDPRAAYGMKTPQAMDKGGSRAASQYWNASKSGPQALAPTAEKQGRWRHVPQAGVNDPRHDFKGQGGAAGWSYGIPKNAQKGWEKTIQMLPMRNFLTAEEEFPNMHMLYCKIVSQCIFEHEAPEAPPEDGGEKFDPEKPYFDAIRDMGPPAAIQKSNPYLKSLDTASFKDFVSLTEVKAQVGMVDGADVDGNIEIGEWWLPDYESEETAKFAGGDIAQKLKDKAIQAALNPAEAEEPAPEGEEEDQPKKGRRCILVTDTRIGPQKNILIPPTEKREASGEGTRGMPGTGTDPKDVSGSPSEPDVDVSDVSSMSYVIQPGLEQPISIMYIDDGTPAQVPGDELKPSDTSDMCGSGVVKNTPANESTFKSFEDFIEEASWNPGPGHGGPAPGSRLNLTDDEKRRREAAYAQSREEEEKAVREREARILAQREFDKGRSKEGEYRGDVAPEWDEDDDSIDRHRGEREAEEAKAAEEKAAAEAKAAEEAKAAKAAQDEKRNVGGVTGSGMIDVLARDAVQQGYAHEALVYIRTYKLPEEQWGALQPADLKQLVGAQGTLVAPTGEQKQAWDTEESTEGSGPHDRQGDPPGEQQPAASQIPAEPNFRSAAAAVDLPSVTPGSPAEEEEDDPASPLGAGRPKDELTFDK